jgi:HSP20 family protein
MLYPASTFLRRDPFEVMRRMTEDFDRMQYGAPRSRGYPAVNVWQGTDAAAVTAELPGVEPENIEISLKDNVLSLSGERKPPAFSDEVVWHQRERAFGKFSRAVRLPFAVDPEKVEARAENGVLQIMLHRREEDKPRRIKVKAA